MRAIATAIGKSARTARRSRGDGRSRRPRFREPMVMIGEPPSETADRAVPGHWEGDLIRGAGNGSAIGTLVERAIRFAILPYLSDGHDAVRVRDAIIRKMAGLPGNPRDGPTWDQREHQRAAAPVLPRGRRSRRLLRGPPRRTHREAQRQAPQNAWIP